MKKSKVSALAMGAALLAVPATPSSAMERTHPVQGQIDWSQVPSATGRNDVARDFVSAPNTLNDILSNDFTAWYPQQYAIDQADTSTGRNQRLAVLTAPAGAMSTASTTVDSTSYSQAAPRSNYNESGATTTQANVANSESPAAAGAGTGAGTGGYTAESSSETTTSNTTTQHEVSKMSDQAKVALAPHALAIESSLKSALNQVEGARSTLKLSQKQGAANSVATSNYQSYVREIRNDVKQAEKHEQMLKQGVRKFPEVAQNGNYRSLEPVFRDVQTQVKSWQSKANSRQYWMNQERAMNDLDRLQKELTNALDKTRSFSSDEFSTSVG